MQEFVGKKVKIVYEDDGEDKAVFGIVQSIDVFFVYLIDDKDRMQSVAIKRIVRIKEVVE